MYRIKWIEWIYPVNYRTILIDDYVKTLTLIIILLQL